jgi:hypothetical protein
VVPAQEDELTEELLTPMEAVDYIAGKWGRRWSVSTIRRWMQVGHIAAVRVGGVDLVPVAEIERIHVIHNPETMRTIDNE